MCPSISSLVDFLFQHRFRVINVRSTSRWARDNQLLLGKRKLTQQYSHFAAMATLRRAAPTFRVPRNMLLLLALGLFAAKILQRENQTLLYLFAIDNDNPGNTATATQSHVRHQSEFPQPTGVVVAYAVSITYCHPDDFIADAAAVLKHSIHLVSSRTTDKHTTSRYDYQMYAFVHPDATNCTLSLKELGYKVLVKDTPIQVDDIQNEELREDITTTGCCHEREFLKLYALTLTEHKIVVHLDLDALLLQPLDALFDAMMLPDSLTYNSPQFSATGDNGYGHEPILKHIPDAMWTEHKSIPITCFFTRDYNSAKVSHLGDLPPNRVNVSWMSDGAWPRERGGSDEVFRRQDSQHEFCNSFLQCQDVGPAIKGKDY